MSTLYLIGIGPGNRGEITEDAIKRLEDSDIIMGYTKYIELIEKFIENRNVDPGSVTDEIERANRAINYVMLIFIWDPIPALVGGDEI